MCHAPAKLGEVIRIRTLHQHPEECGPKAGCLHRLRSGARYFPGLCSSSLLTWFGPSLMALRAHLGGLGFEVRVYSPASPPPPSRGGLARLFHSGFFAGGFGLVSLLWGSAASPPRSSQLLPLLQIDIDVPEAMYQQADPSRIGQLCERLLAAAGKGVVLEAGKRGALLHQHFRRQRPVPPVDRQLVARHQC